MNALEDLNAKYFFFPRLFPFLLFHFFLFSSLCAQPPVAAFSANSTTGCFPLIVTFADTSSGNPVSWQWDFGNGNTSSLKNPSAIYSTANNYTVQLIVCNANGCDTLIKNNFITVADKPATIFAVSDSGGCAPLALQFSDSSIPASSPLISWYWDFGDGSFSLAQNPSHTYPFPGLFKVSLSVTDSLGCNHSASIDSFIIVSTPPSVSFFKSDSSSCTPPLNVIFSNTTVQGTYPVAEWFWDFGDGFSDTTFNAQHQFDSLGVFPVTLSAADSIGCIAMLADSNGISIGKDSVDFTFTSVRTCENLEVSFSGMASDSMPDWQWDFGDGTPPGSGQNAVHNYTNSGVFTVILIAANIAGCPDTVSKSLSYLKVNADFVPDTTYGCSTPFLVSFTDSSAGTPPLNYQWDFKYNPLLGFVPQSIVQNPFYSYNNSNVYDVMLVVTDTFGCRDTTSLSAMNDSIVVFDLNAKFLLSADKGCAPLSVNFTDSSNGGSYPITGWQWNFDDTASGASNFSSLQNPAHTFIDTLGNFIVKLTVTNTLGCIDSTTRTVVTGYPPMGDSLTKSADTACHGALVTFLVYSADTNVNGGYWNWGDGSGNGGLNGLHAFQALGDITVEFSPMVNGCSGNTLYDQIFILPPKPLFTYTPDFSCSAPLSVSFTNISLSYDSIHWDFGDGSPLSDIENPVHSYTAPGAYYSSLIVTNVSTGCTDSTRHRIDIPQPTAGFIADKLSGCTPLTVNFSNLSTTSLPSYYPIVSYFWDFGDNTTSTLENPVHTYSDTSSFTVMLVITDFAGCRDTLIIPGYINTSTATAAFSISAEVGCPYLSVSFTDQSNAYASVVAWNWDFGDGSPAVTTQNPTHIYENPGAFSPLLAITDALGCSNTFSMPAAILVTKPNAQFSSPARICELQSAFFTNNTAGTGLSYLWDFGDGDTSTNVNPVHIFSDTGFFSTVLIVTDTNNCSDTATNQIESVAPPVANFEVDTFLAYCPPLLVQFSDLSTNIGDSIVLWQWNFGDNGIATVANPVHTYIYADTFSVNLTVTNTAGCSNILFIPDIIKVAGPYGNFSFLPDTGCVPINITFSASTGNTEELIWDFGDGVVDSTFSSTINHSYIQAGFPNPQLSLVDSIGCKAAAFPSGSSLISLDKVVSGFSFSPATLYTPLCPPDTVFFNNLSFAQNDSSQLTQWFWDFGDGKTDTAFNPIHVYMDTGIYNITLISYSSMGCSDTLVKTISVILDDTLVLKAFIQNSTDVTCFGLSDGECTATGYSGTPPYAYMWNDSAWQNTATATGLLPGIYDVWVSDSMGCMNLATVQINEPDQLALIMDSLSDVSCKGLSDGSIAVGTAGGIQPYTYQWTSTDSIWSGDSASVMGLPPSVYTVTVTDFNGCTTVWSDTIREPDSLLIFIVETIPASCFGDSTGSAIVGASGGTSPYSFSWVPSFAGTNDTAIYLNAQIYTVEVSDNNGCDTSSGLTITQPSLLTTVTTKEDVSCFNGNNGSVNVTPAGGISPYSYLWSTGDSTASVTNLPTLVYEVSVTDSNGCTDINSVEITEPDSLTFSFETDSVSCFGGNDGSATAIVSGGTSPYNYLWSNGDSALVANGLPSFIHYVTVTDSAGCFAFDSIPVFEPDTMILALASDSVSCFEGSDGYAVVMAVGGTPPYTYLWNDTAAQVSPIASGLAAGTWLVTVTDTNLCAVADTVIVSEPLPVTLDINTTDALCQGDSTGTASIIANGGASPYFYLWSSGDSMASISGLPSSIYSVTVTDVNNCQKDTQAAVSEPSQLIVLTATESVTCFSGNNGSVTVTPGGGISPYNYLWSTGDSTASVADLPSLVYYVTVTDSNGCTNLNSVEIIEPDSIVFAFDTDSVSCFGGNDGSATATVSGGTSPYNYLWSTGDSTASVANLPSLVYHVTVTDGNGCINIAMAIITGPDSIAFAFSTDSVSCYGGNDGSAAVALSGGTPPFSFLWSNGDTIESTDGLSSSLYSVTATDSKNCAVTDTVMVSEPLPVILEINTTDVLCNGDSTGTASVIASGGTPPYSFLWNCGDTTEAISGLPAFFYSVTVTDANNCEADTQAMVSEPLQLTASILKIRAVLCYGENNGELAAQPSGGVPSYNYLWEPGNATTASISGLSPGIYILVVTDTNNCKASDTTDITELSAFAIAIAANDSDTVCYNVVQPLDAQPTGSAPPYSFYWSDGTNIMAGNPIFPQPLVSETWMLTATDSAGCTASGNIFLFINQLQVSINYPDTACFYSEISFEATASGAMPGSTYSYQWNSGQTTAIFTTSLINSNYIVTVSDGCSEPANDTATIFSYPVPAINMEINSWPVCPLTEIFFTETENNQQGYSHSWDFGDGAFADGVNAQHSYSAGGEYYPSVTVSSSEGCKYTDSVSQPLVIYAMPGAEFTAEPYIANILSPEIQFTDLSVVTPVVQDEITAYSWNFGDGGLSNLQHVSHIFNDTGTYSVTLTVTTQFGCEDEFPAIIVILPHIDLLIPDAFTPNPLGSSGGYYDRNSFDNNVFYPITEYVQEYLLQIFNRWGEMVFESTNIAIGWDGYYKGKPVQKDTYLWKMKIVWTTGEGFDKAGRVLLIR